MGGAIYVSSTRAVALGKSDSRKFSDSLKVKDCTSTVWLPALGSNCIASISPTSQSHANCYEFICTPYRIPLPPDPLTLRGGCNCRAIRCRINVPDISDRPLYFAKSSKSRQEKVHLPMIVIDLCNDCRRATGSIIPSWICTPISMVSIPCIDPAPMLSTLPNLTQSRLLGHGSPPRGYSNQALLVRIHYWPPANPPRGAEGAFAGVVAQALRIPSFRPKTAGQRCLMWSLALLIGSS